MADQAGNRTPSNHGAWVSIRSKFSEVKEADSEFPYSRIRVLTGLILLAVLTHVAFHVWNILQDPNFSHDPLGRALGANGGTDVTIRDVASFSLGSQADFLRAPFFGIVKFVTYALFGFSTSALTLTMVVINAVLGTLLLYLIVEKLFGSRVALIAGLLNATYFEGFMFPAVRTSYSNLNFVFVLGMIYLFLKHLDGRHSRKIMILSALVYGFALNTDSKLLLFPILELGALAFLLKGLHKIDFVRTAVCYFGFAIVLLPFLVRNYAYTGDFRPIQNNGTVAFASALARFDNSHFVNEDYPWIYTEEEATTRGMVHTDSAEKAILPAVRAEMREALRDDPFLFVTSSAYNFIRIVLPWTLHNETLKGRFVKGVGPQRTEVSDGTEDEVGVREGVSGLSLSGRVVRYLHRELGILWSVVLDAFDLVVRVLVFLVPMLVPIFYLLGVLNLVWRGEFQILLIALLPVIYYSGTLTWILVNPDYLLASNFTFLTLASVALNSLWGLTRRTGTRGAGLSSVTTPT